MDLTLRDARGAGGVPGGAPADSLLKRDFMASMDKDIYDKKGGETVSKSDYRPLVDEKDSTKNGMFSQPKSSSELSKNYQPCFLRYSVFVYPLVW